MKPFSPIVAGVAITVLGIGALVLLQPGPTTTGGQAGGTSGARVSPGAAAEDPLGFLSARGYLGVVVSGEAVDVAARVGGQLTDMQVRLGDQVAQDSILATLDAGPLRDELAMARASLRAARAEEQKAALELEEAGERHARWRQAVELQRSAVSEEELANVRYQEKYAASQLEAARARVAEQQARVAELERKVADTTVRAPFPGLVAARYADPGATISQGAPLVRLVRAGELWVRFAIPENRGSAARAGQAVEVRMDELDTVLAGEVEKIAPEVDAASRMIIAEARLTVPDGLTQATLSGRVARVHVIEAKAARPDGDGAP